MTDKIRKYVLPNVPYLLVLWFCLKLGTAYRMALGADFSNKLIGTIQTIGPAFATIAPGFVLFDWLTDIAGDVLIRLVVWGKVKKQRSFGGMWNTARPGGERKKT